MMSWKRNKLVDPPFKLYNLTKLKMKLSELIELLQKIEKIVWGETNVLLRDYEQGRNELFGVLPQTDEQGEIFLLLE